ncbi:hypothetical protein GGR58DRAFT_501590 [Xylaria digitata]|nr:hypothetical protein GGR58DRAFT_501590 [Xylaria digitata]
MGNEDKKERINLLRGWPSTSLLPAATPRAASQTALPGPSIWGRGLESAVDPRYQLLRGLNAGSSMEDKSSKDWNARKDDDEVGRINTMGGASQSLACLLQAFTDLAGTLAVWVAPPCYFLARAILVDARFAGRMCAMPEDKQGG